MDNHYKFILTIAVIFTIMSCSETGIPNPPAKKLANPAAQKCIQDGYELVPQMVNGIPNGYRCVDSETKKGCEVWQYFRGECDLSSNDSPAEQPERINRGEKD